MEKTELNSELLKCNTELHKIKPLIHKINSPYKIYEKHLTEKVDDSIEKIKKVLSKQDTMEKHDLEFGVQSTKKDCFYFWHQLIENFCEQQLKKIDKRKTRGQEFVELKKLLKNTIHEMKYDDELSFDDLQNIFNDVEGYAEQIKEKMRIELYNLVLFALGIIIGFILGKLI